jgi:hypothetical protein
MQEVDVLHSSLLKIKVDEAVIGTATGITFNEGFNIMEAKGIGDFYPQELIKTGGTVRVTSNFFYIKSLADHPMTKKFLKRDTGEGAEGKRKFVNNQMFQMTNVAIEVYRLKDIGNFDEYGNVEPEEESLFTIRGLVMESNDWSINVDQMITGSATFRGKNPVTTPPAV